MIINCPHKLCKIILVNKKSKTIHYKIKRIYDDLLNKSNNKIININNLLYLNEDPLKLYSNQFKILRVW